jgi:hypothetical protein
MGWRIGAKTGCIEVMSRTNTNNLIILHGFMASSRCYRLRVLFAIGLGILALEYVLFLDPPSISRLLQKNRL